MDITINHIKKHFGAQCACDIPALTIHAGECIGLVGNNGAGKTTLFRLMLDLINPDEGDISIGGMAVNATEDWKPQTGAYLDESFLINYLTPEEYFGFLARVEGIPKDVLEEWLEAFSRLMAGEILGKKKLIRELSAGNRQKVGIIGAMLHQPRVLILDEPFNFLDPSGQIAVKQLLAEYNKAQGATILVSSHNLQHTIDTSSRLLLLEAGRIVKDTVNDAGEGVDDIKNYFIKED